jgi:hypothetical protein
MSVVPATNKPHLEDTAIVKASGEQFDFRAIVTLAFYERAKRPRGRAAVKALYASVILKRASCRKVLGRPLTGTAIRIP